jgi:hypothetical protein
MNAAGAVNSGVAGGLAGAYHQLHQFTLDPMLIGQQAGALPVDGIKACPASGCAGVGFRVAGMW